MGKNNKFSLEKQRFFEYESNAWKLDMTLN